MVSSTFESWAARRRVRTSADARNLGGHPNGTQTVYGHMKNNYVTVGQRVDQGDVIGTIGVTGNTTGPHVHFEIRGARNPF